MTPLRGSLALRCTRVKSCRRPVRPDHQSVPETVITRGQAPSFRRMARLVPCSEGRTCQGTRSDRAAT